MKIILILAHPKPGSFNHAIAETATTTLMKNGHEVIYHDLYLEGFDPILTADEIQREATLDPSISEHCADLSSADGIIIVHPNWWGQPPAILTGWVDRVVRAGVAYEFVEGDSGEGIPEGLLKARSALVFNTSNTPQQREQEVFGDPLESLWKKCIFGLCGVDTVYRHTFAVMVTSSENQQETWLEEVKGIVGECFNDI